MNSRFTQSQLAKTDQKRLNQFRTILLDWFAKFGRYFPWRKKSTTKYELILAEVLLQRTKAENVANFFSAFVKEFPSWRKLSQANEAQLAKLLQPIGLWKRRAASLYLLAQEMYKKNGRFPKSRKDIEALPGIGQYIANAVLLFCHGVPQPLLDSNMARLLERVFGPRRLADIRYDPYLQSLSLEVVRCKKAKELNWAILDFAAIVCTIKNPKCLQCPLRSDCQYVKNTKDFK
jgi:A/G-specific adenine glycosylase